MQPAVSSEQHSVVNHIGRYPPEVSLGLDGLPGCGSENAAFGHGTKKNILLNHMDNFGPL